MDVDEHDDEQDIDESKYREDKGKIRSSIEADIQKYLASGGGVTPPPPKMNRAEIKQFMIGFGKNTWKRQSIAAYRERTNNEQ